MQVKVRLHTLEYLYDNSALVLGTEQVKRLWACLGPRPAVPADTPETEGDGTPKPSSVTTMRPEVVVATPGEVSTLLSWLSKACEAVEGESRGGMFAPGVAADFFEVRYQRGAI